MKRTILSLVVIALLLTLGAAQSYAQAAPAAPAAAAPAQGTAGTKDEAVRNFDDASSKILRLAEAFPAEKYTWRPGEGVRSVSEVLLHVAAGDFNIPRRLGTPPPEGFQPSPNYDKSSTDKAQVVATLKQAIEHVKKAYAAVDDAEKTSPWFGGRQASMREIMFFLASHNHEHLGQLIAYARMNGITPPWTEEAQQRQQQQPAKRP